MARALPLALAALAALALAALAPAARAATVIKTHARRSNFRAKVSDASDEGSGLLCFELTRDALWGDNLCPDCETISCPATFNNVSKVAPGEKRCCSDGGGATPEEFGLLQYVELLGEGAGGAACPCPPPPPPPHTPWPGMNSAPPLQMTCARS